MLQRRQLVILATTLGRHTHNNGFCKVEAEQGLVSWTFRALSSGVKVPKDAVAGQVGDKNGLTRFVIGFVGACGPKMAFVSVLTSFLFVFMVPTSAVDPGFSAPSPRLLRAFSAPSPPLGCR